MEGRVFDAQVVLSPKDSPVGKQLLQYVCVRVTRMDNVDVALFDRDWNNAIYFFAINADEQVYLRYGGRESEDPDTYNSLDSLEIALREGLRLHQRFLAGDFKPGEHLSELSLLQMVKASRTQIRVALERLAQEGLLETLPTTGFRVRGFALNDIWDAIEIRGVLEGTAARLAAERLESPDELGALRLHCRQAEELLPMARDRFARYAEIN